MRLNCLTGCSNSSFSLITVLLSRRNLNQQFFCFWLTIRCESVCFSFRHRNFNGSKLPNCAVNVDSSCSSKFLVLVTVGLTSSINVLIENKISMEQSFLGKTLLSCLHHNLGNSKFPKNLLCFICLNIKTHVSP